MSDRLKIIALVNVAAEKYRASQHGTVGTHEDYCAAREAVVEFLSTAITQARTAQREEDVRLMRNDGTVMGGCMAWWLASQPLLLSTVPRDATDTREDTP